MTKPLDLALTALAPIVWGTTYYVTTEYLPAGYPITMSVLRALPAGLLLLLIVRKLPDRTWIGRIFLLGFFNFTLFWSMLFIAAYRLPGGVAATVTAVQALIVIFLAYFFLNRPIYAASIAAALVGVGGVGLLLLEPSAQFDTIGLIAGIVGAFSMAAGSVFSRKWQPPVSLLTFTAWQLTAGGLLLVPLALIFEPELPTMTAHNWTGVGYLTLIGAALTYFLWFRGVARIEPSAIATLGFFSPLTAVLLGWLALNENLTPLQWFGVALVFGSVWFSQKAANRKPAPTLATEKS